MSQNKTREARKTGTIIVGGKPWQHVHQATAFGSARLRDRNICWYQSETFGKVGLDIVLNIILPKFISLKVMLPITSLFLHAFRRTFKGSLQERFRFSSRFFLGLSSGSSANSVHCISISKSLPLHASAFRCAAERASELSAKAKLEIVADYALLESSREHISCKRRQRLL